MSTGICRLSWFALGLVTGALCVQIFTGNARAVDMGVYDNLQKTRDALLQQRDYLQRAYDDTSKAVDALQRKLSHINEYLDRNDKNLHDIDQALSAYPR